MDLATALEAIAALQKTIRADETADYCQAEAFLPGAKYTPQPPVWLNSYEFLASKENPGWRQFDYMIRMQFFAGPALIDTPEYGALCARIAFATHAVFKPGVRLGEGAPKDDGYQIVDPVLRGTPGLFQPADLEWNGAHFIGLEFLLELRLNIPTGT